MIRYHFAFRPGHTLDYGLRALESGMHGIEIQSCRSYVPQKTYEDYIGNTKVLLAQGASITIHAPIADINLGSTNQAMRQLSVDQIKEAARLALELDASVVVVHAGMGVLTMPAGRWSKDPFLDFYSAHQDMVDKVHTIVTHSLQEIADAYPKVIFGLENLVYPHELYRFPREMLELISRVNRPNIGMTLDIGHGSTVGQNAVAFLGEVYEKVRHVHMHDNHGVWDEHLPLGKGNIDYRAFSKALAAGGYDGVVTFEFTLPDPRDFRQIVANA